MGGVTVWDRTSSRGVARESLVRVKVQRKQRVLSVLREAANSRDAINVSLCLRTVDGNWSEWSVWEECSRTCGQGNRTRVRTCSDPPAQYGGRPCEGAAVEVIMCSVRPCPGEESEMLPVVWQLLFESTTGKIMSNINLTNLKYI